VLVLGPKLDRERLLRGGDIREVTDGLPLKGLTGNIVL